MTQLWTTREVAAALGVHPRTVERRQWLRQLAVNLADPGQKRQIRYPQAAVERELTRRTLAGAGGRAGAAA